MGKFFKEKDIKINPPNEDYEILSNALKSTMSVCIASTSALVINHLTEKIRNDRMAQYNENSFIAMNGIGNIRSFLLKISKYMEEKKIAFMDARAAIKYTLSECRAGNCEHQSFYLATLLRQQNIQAYVYDIEDIQHTVVITKDFLLDPWIGAIFSINDTDLCEFYGSTLNMKASWLNHLLCNKEFTYYERLNKTTLKHYFSQLAVEKEINVTCCTLI